MRPSPTGRLGVSRTKSGKAGTLLGARNLLKAGLLLLGTCGVLGAAGWVLGGYRLLSIFVFCGLLLGLAVYWYADRAVLGMVKAREVPAGEAPALHSALEKLAVRAGIAKPRLYLIDSGHPHALSAGRGPHNAAIAVSAGIVSLLDPAELEGVLAHEVAHLRHRDVLLQTGVVLVASGIVELSRVGGFLQRSLLFVLGPVAAAFVHLLLSPRREFAADRAAAELCSSPHGLAGALVRLEQAGELVRFTGSPVTEPLYTINPFAEEGVAALFVTHPPVGERVQRLRALDPEWRERLQAA
jgi:heat shock protein HtpX